MTEADLPRILELEEICFPESPWPRKEYLYELHENPFSCLQVIEEAGVIAGYIDWWILYDKAQLANIAVDPAYRGRVHPVGAAWAAADGGIRRVMGAMGFSCMEPPFQGVYSMLFCKAVIGAA